MRNGASVRAVVDTNVLLSGLIWHGSPHALLERVRAGALTLVSSPALLAELADVLGRPKFSVALALSGTDAARMLAEVRILADIVDPPRLPTPVSHDADDDAVLALAVAAHADLIVSGDDDLLILGTYAGVPIVTPARAVAMVAS